MKDIQTTHLDEHAKECLDMDSKKMNRANSHDVARYLKNKKNKVNERVIAALERDFYNKRGERFIPLLSPEEYDTIIYNLLRHIKSK